jgi:preprotein translocase subunit SecA
MRLFGSERIANILTKWGGMQEGEDIQHPIITRQIGKAQSKVEAMNFDRRKRTLEYDDVMNTQRDVIYSRRAQALFGTPEQCRPIVLDTCAEAIEEAFLTEFAPEGADRDRADIKGFLEWVQRMVPLVSLSDLANLGPRIDRRPEAQEAWRDELLVSVMKRVGDAYDEKSGMLGPELTLAFTQFVLLRTIDQDWRDHLLAMDELRAGIGLRGYAQRNPLHEYQQEGYQQFEELMGNVTKEIFERWFRLQVVERAPPGTRPPMSTGRGHMPGAMPPPGTAGGPPPGLPPGATAGDRPAKPQSFKRDVPKVKPNDPCPCGSGKKYKKCHGRLHSAAG